MATRRSITGFLATLVLTALLGGTAQAGIIWCVKDPIFVVDGRVVQVKDLVPLENVNAPLHFVLRVAEGSVASWYLPPGETLLGTVTIVVDHDVRRDTPRLSVRGEGPPFPMRLIVSGSGLRVPAFEVQGTSELLKVDLSLVSGHRADHDSD